MRYRPFGAAGQSCSALTLSLREGLTQRTADDLVCAALECGVNSFVAPLNDAVAAEAIANACAAVERRMLLVHLRARLPVHRAAADVQETLRLAGLEHADSLSLELVEGEAITETELAIVQKLRSQRRIVRLGIWGEGTPVDAQLKRIGYDLLATSYSVRSGWPERNRIKSAVQNGLTILGWGFHVDAARQLAAEHAPKGLQRLFHRPTRAVAHAYDFLNHTPGWTPEQITLAYALTEPALASVVVDVAQPAMLETLSAAVDRELPPSAAAQVEIARFAA